MTDPKQMPEQIYALRVGRWFAVGDDPGPMTQEYIADNPHTCVKYNRADLVPQIDVDGLFEQITMAARAYAIAEYMNGKLGVPMVGPGDFDTDLRRILTEAVGGQSDD
jgi:hypothetical protein